MSDDQLSRIWQQLNELRVVVARIDERTANAEESHGRLRSLTEINGERITKIEKTHERVGGYFAGFSIAGGAIGAGLAKLFGVDA